MLFVTVGIWLFVAAQANLPQESEAPPFTIEDLSAPNYDGPKGMWCTGLNAAGFDLGAYGGRYSKHYRVPDLSNIEYFYNRGANCFRLPITWERLQMSLGDEHLSLVPGYEKTIDFITQNLSSWAIVDPHNNDAGLQFNYGSYENVKLRDASKADFIKLWKALATKFKNNSKVIFELYNEPKWGRENGKNKYFDFENDDLSGELIEAWRQWMQETIDEIRALGATNMILVPGLKHTNCRDWDGAGYWGESLDNYSRAGNTRLAALKDPEMKLIYDVHQYFDTTWTKSFTGDQYGCDAHDATVDGYMGADAGCLGNMLKWAKKYNKKVMVTEIASLPDPDYAGYNWTKCEEKMRNFLQKMNDSEVFLGFQIWQFGCESCKGDLDTSRPLNLDWYGLGTWVPSSTEVPEYDSAALTEPNYGGPEGMWCTGVNAIGFDLDERYGRDSKRFTIPDQDALRYFHNQGANCFRLSITWERMQEKLGDKELDLVLGYEETVDFITETLGDYVIIDPHNNVYGLKFHAGLDKDLVPRVVDVTRADFVRLWHAIAKKWRNNPRVIFGLYNEPKGGYGSGAGDYFKVEQVTGQMVETWRQWTQSAIDEVRALGANNTILVSGLKYSTCRDWDGAGSWVGNDRLAALTDPRNRLAYDVHQYFDSTERGSFSGDQYNCDGHDQTVQGHIGADEGCLTNLVDWAKKHKKKFMMTEIATIADPKNDSKWAVCKSKMQSFLQRMNESGVFLGYQVWQFGCPECKGDLYENKLSNWSNLAWYGLDLYGTSRTSTSTTSTSTTLMTSTVSTTTELQPLTTGALCAGGNLWAVVLALGPFVHSLL